MFCQRPPSNEITTLHLYERAVGDLDPVVEAGASSHMTTPRKHSSNRQRCNRNKGTTRSWVDQPG